MGRTTGESLQRREVRYKINRRLSRPNSMKRDIRKNKNRIILETKHVIREDLFILFIYLFHLLLPMTKYTILKNVHYNNASHLYFAQKCKTNS